MADRIGAGEVVRAVIDTEPGYSQLTCRESEGATAFWMTLRALSRPFLFSDYLVALIINKRRSKKQGRLSGRPGTIGYDEGSGSHSFGGSTRPVRGLGREGRRRSL